MSEQASIQEKLEKISQVYPAEAERLKQCAEVLLERDQDVWRRALEKQLDRILGAPSPVKARTYIDQMEHTTMKHPMTSPFLGARESGKNMRIVIGIMLAITAVAAFATSILLSLYR